VNTPELQIQLQEGENYALIEKLQKTAKFDNPKEINTIDGLRVDTQRVWPDACIQHYTGDCVAFEGIARRAEAYSG